MLNIKNRELGINMTTTSEQENCPHHWVIDSPKGPMSTGHCKICDLTKEFMNSISEANWDKSPVKTDKKVALTPEQGKIDAEPEPVKENAESKPVKEI